MPTAFFVPAAAQHVSHDARPGTHEIRYVVAERYPATRFLCELANHLDREGWRGLREDALNPENPTSLVDGWGEFINGTRKPETHVHGWSAQWLNRDGDLLLYALSYEYPEHAQPELSQLTVSALLWPKDVVRTHLGSRAEQISALAVIGKPHGEASTVRSDTACVEPAWSKFVRSATGSESPGIALPYEVTHIRSIEVVHDIDGLAKRIADAMRSRLPNLRVVTLHDRTPEGSDALLDFRFECRCNEQGAPNGFYVREVVMYKPESEPVNGWIDPPRVLFHWSDGGEPMWKGVPARCFNEKPRTSSCTAAFQQADIAFVDDLASAIGRE